MDSRSCRRAIGLALCGLLAPSVANAYSTKLHMITGHHLVKMLRDGGCKLRVGGWNKKVGALDLRARVPGAAAQDVVDDSAEVDLSGELCKLITDPATEQYFVSGTTAPDTFPGMFGNTDPTHALLWNTSWQIPVLWQNARDAKEKAFVLGWVVHFAGDLNAHGLANLHATGGWMADGRPDTVWKHLVAEMYYAMKMLPYPKGFNNRLLWPEAFVKRMFLNPESPLYKHLDYNWNRYVGSDKIGGPAKVFGALLRAMFLLWDFHAREMQRWEGRKNYFIAHKDRSLRDWLHWAFADQAWNWHKKKIAAAKRSIDAWYEATHRAQQSVVADLDAVWNGREKFPKPTFDDEGKVVTVKNDAYRSKGMGGIEDAFAYLGEALANQFTPNLTTITSENFPELRAILDAAHYVKEGLQKLAAAFTNAMKAALAPIGNAIHDLIDPIVKDLQGWLQEGAFCTAMPAMCRTIDAQTAAFGIKPGQLETYLNWPIYRNTITAAALMLDKLKTLDRRGGDETMSPSFGLPSGDFGCTLACTKMFEEGAALFMPAAGKYYQSRQIQQALPDYCVYAGDKRGPNRANDVFDGLSNNQANVTAKGTPAFTCLQRTPAEADDSPRNDVTPVYPEFELNGWKTLAPQDQVSLRGSLQKLKAQAGVTLVLVGHTDCIPPPKKDGNYYFGLARAETVRDFFKGVESQLGLTKLTYEATSKGDTERHCRPGADPDCQQCSCKLKDKDTAGCKRDRRVEVKFP